jgi:hypothetical protein
MDFVRQDERLFATQSLPLLSGTRPPTYRSITPSTAAETTTVDINVEFHVSGGTNNVAHTFQGELFGIVRLCVAVYDDSIVDELHLESVDSTPGALLDLPLNGLCQFRDAVPGSLFGHHCISPCASINHAPVVRSQLRW